MGLSIKIYRTKKAGEVKLRNNIPIFRNKKRRILAIVLTEGHGSRWVWLNENQDRFSIAENTYFKLDGGTYIRGSMRFMIFMESVSLPIGHQYIQREEIEKTIVDRQTGEDKTITINKIKGLNFDSKIADILLNRHLADEFTKTHFDLPNLIIIILLIVTVVLGVLNIISTLI